MKVNRPEIINIIHKIYKKDRLQGPSRAGESPGLNAADRVEISSSIEALKKEMARLEETDPSRLQKIADLARQVEAGEYRVDPRELAAAILAAARKQP